MHPGRGRAKARQTQGDGGEFCGAPCRRQAGSGPPRRRPQARAPATCHLPPATCNLQPATGNRQPATCHIPTQR
ncbi:MAG: hypothetical protein EOO29_03185 [Comamonadaceae bacterium]|nr:MAG: hypothetical protein EOO29_03185 [Comamonadaceae bacterium]